MLVYTLSTASTIMTEMVRRVRRQSMALLGFVVTSASIASSKPAQLQPGKPYTVYGRTGNIYCTLSYHQASSLPAAPPSKRW